jgi:hypothetical protein
VNKEMRKKQREHCSQSAKTYGGIRLLEGQNDERRFRDALEDDDVREALKLMHERYAHLEKAGRERLEVSKGRRQDASSGGAPISGRLGER